MTTALTPRLQRAIDYATQEIFTVLPDMIPALMADVAKMQQQDFSEVRIIQNLYKAVLIALQAEALRNVFKEVLESLPQGPVH